jgi:hypothetical protein
MNNVPPARHFFTPPTPPHYRRRAEPRPYARLLPITRLGMPLSASVS